MPSRQPDFLHQTLYTSDIHLTDNPRDEYRWKLFDELVFFTEEHPVDNIVILGDVTDAKDRHSAVLVNRIFKGMDRLAQRAKVYILCGNHDVLKPGHPFLACLSYIPDVKFITTPRKIGNAFFLPHPHTPGSAALTNGVAAEIVLMHLTVRGSVFSNGMAAKEGVDPDMGGMRVLSGDIHVPQMVGDVEYVGSPYHVHFGDDFAPRLVYFDAARNQQSIPTNFPRRVVVVIEGEEDITNLNLDVGDQVKLRVSLAQRDFDRWQEVKRKAEDAVRALGAELVATEVLPRIIRARKQLGVASSEIAETVSDVVGRYAEKEGLEEPVVEVGREVARETQTP